MDRSSPHGGQQRNQIGYLCVIGEDFHRLSVMLMRSPDISSRVASTFAATAIFIRFQSACKILHSSKETDILIKDIEEHIPRAHRKHSVCLSNWDKLEYIHG